MQLVFGLHFSFWREDIRRGKQTEKIVSDNDAAADLHSHIIAHAESHNVCPVVNLVQGSSHFLVQVLCAGKKT